MEMRLTIASAKPWSFFSVVIVLEAEICLMRQMTYRCTRRTAAACAFLKACKRATPGTMKGPKLVTFPFLECETRVLQAGRKITLARQPLSDP